MKIGLDNYRVGQKDNWRKWQWNRVVERLDPGSDGYILYLPAEQDLDRKIAISKGIHPDRLVAVDMRAGVVRDIRRQKKTAVQGKLHNVIANWPQTRAIDAVIADFCSGLSADVAIHFPQSLWQTQELLHRSNNSYGSIISVNMQRGRETPIGVLDGDTVPMSVVADKAAECRYMYTGIFEDLLGSLKDKRFNPRKAASFFMCAPSLLPKTALASFSSLLDAAKTPKHRGLLFFECFYNQLYPQFRTLKLDESWLNFPGIADAKALGASDNWVYQKLWFTQACTRFYMRSMPAFGSYRASRVVMDSVVFRFGDHANDIFDFKFPFENMFSCASQKRRISAALAVNTMRRTGRLMRGAA